MSEMSTEPVQESQSGEVECRNAREYALKRVEEEDGEIMKSEDLAEEYKCSKEHMQDVLRELSKEGEIKRVGFGRYAAKSADTEDEVPDEEGRDDDLPSMDGGARSRDTDTTETYPDGREPVECPAEGCEYEGFSVEGLRKHSNAVRSHDWEDIEDQLDMTELEDFEWYEGSQEETMAPTEEEMQLQREMVVDELDQDDGDDDVDDREDEGDEETVEDVEEIEASSGGMPNIPVEVVVAAAVVVFVAWWLFFRSDSSTEQQQEEQGQQDILEDATGLI